MPVTTGTVRLHPEVDAAHRTLHKHRNAHFDAKEAAEQKMLAARDEHAEHMKHGRTVEAADAQKRHDEAEQERAEHVAALSGIAIIGQSLMPLTR